MSTAAQQPLLIPDPQTPAAEPAPEQRTYTFQPKDADGNPLGGPQVIKYTTDQELADKLAEQNSSLIRMNRELKWKADRPAEGDVPADAERLDWDTTTPRPLQPEERLQLAREVQDPEKMDAALARLFEGIFGVKPTDVADLNRNMRAIRAAEEGRAFVESHPEFYACLENVQKLQKWCMARKLAPVQANFVQAYTKLKEAGLLLEAPIAAEETRANTQPEAETTEGRITPPEATLPTTRPESTSSGLTRSNTSGGGGTAARRGLTWADVDRMTQAEFEKKYRVDAGFRNAVDALPRR
jgi:hypothetical protein